MLTDFREFVKNLLLLMSGPLRRRFYVALGGSVLLSLADVAGVLAILPLMQLLTGSPQDEGILGTVSSILGNPSPTKLAIYLAAFTFGAFAFKGVATLVFKWWLLGFVAEQEAVTSTRILGYYLQAPYGLHLKRNSADLLRALIDACRNVYTGQVFVGVISIVSEFFTLVVVAVVLVVLVPGPAVVLILYFAAVGLLLYLLVRPMTARAGQQMLDSYSVIYREAMQDIGGVKEIKIRHKVPYFLDSYRRGRDELAAAERRAAFFGELPRYILEVVFIFGIGITVIIVFASTPSTEAVAVLAILAAAGFRLLPSAVRLLAAMNVVRFGKPSFDLLVTELASAIELEQQTPQVDVPATTRIELRQTVRVEDVVFSYEDQLEPAVDGVSLTIPVGHAVGLVGPSGSGKSTLIDVLLGLQSPSSGRVTVDGVDVAEILPAWQQSLGLVPQDVYLLDSSLRGNIAFGERPEEIDDLRLAEAVTAAQLDDVVAGLPEGLDTRVGERGVRLSGGQRQRIGIARALYGRPTLLLLDEATSALDNDTERRISETITNLRGKVTIVLVAHRLSTVRHCDTIVFLRDGKVAATGTFDELAATDEDFARLVELGRL